MIRTLSDRQQSAFSWWLRTGRLPPVPTADGIECKFNPWHDPMDGRFTFAGSGRHYGAGGAGPSGRATDRNTKPIDRQKPQQARIAKWSIVAAPPAGQRGHHSKKPVSRATIEAQTKPLGSRRTGQSNQAAEFITGVGEGVYDVAEGTVAAAYAALTTNPVTTVRNAGREIAAMIDTAIAAEDIPARVQVSRAADAIANASPRDIGRAAGTIASNTALAVAPGAALARFSEVRRLRMARPSPGPFPLPEIGWVKENLVSDKDWKIYNDTAPGARPGKAPTLTRTMADGSKRPVKFDGVQGEYPVDRKWSIRDMPRARAQILRQSEALTQNRSIGVWEVPNEIERRAARNLLKKMNIKTIKVRVVKP